MKRMVTEEEIIKLIQKYAPGFDPSAVEEGDILQNEVLGLDSDGEIVKGNLFGKYVRIIKPFASTTLTDDDIEILKGGAIMEGNYLGIHNPLFCPATVHTQQYEITGLLLGSTLPGSAFDQGIYMYRIALPNKQIAKVALLTTNVGNNNQTSVTGRWRLGATNTDNCLLNGSHWPKFAVSTTGTRLIHWVNGIASFVEPLYMHTVVFDVGGGQSFTIRLISNSSTTCAKDTDTGNFTIPGSTFIQPVNMGNVVIVPFNANQFTPDIYAFDSATGAFTDNITLASVTSDTVTPVG